MAQAGFPLTREEEELINSEDAQMGRPTARYLHPAISEFIADMQAELTSMGQLPTTLEQAAIDLEEGWSHKHVTGGGRITGSPDPPTSPVLAPPWELDPLPLMANNPPDHRLQHQNHTAGRILERVVGSPRKWVQFPKACSHRPRASVA
jgi:hypothetical protein